MLTQDYFNNVKGAAYVPTRVYNAYQMWRDYDSAVIERDFGFAQSLHLNAIRLWLSYEYWLEQPDSFKRNWENMIEISERKGLKIMPSLFECCGHEPTRENLENTDQFEGDAIRSPGTEITENKERWDEPFKYFDWFIKQYGSDSRLLAIEVTNEPKNVADHLFGLALLKRAKEIGCELPLTLGSEMLQDNLIYKEYIDIFQTHENVPVSEAELIHALNRGKMVQEIVKKPVWVTEWQQIREGGWGSMGEKMDKETLRPRHYTQAAVIHESGLGNFVWNLMLRPAYIARPRSVGSFNGIFHEDGSVYSLKDARAVAGDQSLNFKENHELPECFDRVAAMSE